MLYPEIEPYESGYVERPPFRVYYERCGTPGGIPVVFLHGGPGSGIVPMERQFFNPDIYDILLFDQRGAGKSVPAGGLTDNTTQFLLSDMEAFREQFGFDRWVVTGGSWGSTLSLAYAARYPERLLGVVVWGIFLGRDSEFYDSYRSGGVASRIVPREHEAFITFLPPDQRDDPVRHYHARAMQDADPELRDRACYLWTLWEEQISALIPDPARIAQAVADQQAATNHARIELHYFIDNCFIDGNAMLGQLPPAGVPLFVINGRYDVLCPIVTACQVAEHASAADLRFQAVPDAGHTMHDPNMQAAIVAYTDQMAILLKASGR